VFLFNPGAGAEVNSNGRYFYSDLAKSFPEMKQTGPDEITDKTTTLGDGPNFVQINGKDALEPSYQAMKQELTVLPKDRHLVVFTQNDDSALGAWRAITQAKREDDTMIIGQGANADGLKNLRTNPSWVAEGSVFFELWPQYLLAMAVSVLNGAKTPPLTLAPQTVLSKENVAKYYGDGDTAIVSPPLAEVNRYLLDAGVLQKFGIDGSK
jgi:ribose transport system substrate-binding protein